MKEQYAMGTHVKRSVSFLSLQVFIFLELLTFECNAEGWCVGKPIWPRYSFKYLEILKWRFHSYVCFCIGPN